MYLQLSLTNRATCLSFSNALNNNLSRQRNLQAQEFVSPNSALLGVFDTGDGVQAGGAGGNANVVYFPGTVKKPLGAKFHLQEFVYLLRVVAGVLGNLRNNYSPIIAILVITPWMPQFFNAHFNPLFVGEGGEVLFELVGFVEEEFALAHDS